MLKIGLPKVYAINDVSASSLMNLAVFLASPLLFLMSTLGAVLGSLAGILLLPSEDFQEVYDGIWGYNAVIATASITCVFFAFNTMSFFQVGSYSYDMTKMLFKVSKLTFIHKQSIILDYSIEVRNLQEKDKIFLAGALGNYSLAGFEMVSLLI